MRRLLELIKRWIMGHRILYIPKPVSGIFYPKYGLIYNGYAALDARYLAATGWHVSSQPEWITMTTYAGGDPSTAGNEIKENSDTYWSTNNGTNTAKFNARGGGNRDGNTGSFDNITDNIRYWTTSYINATFRRNIVIDTSDSVNTTGSVIYRNFGSYVRLVKDSTTLSDGQEGTYTGNDGKVYRTICIGTQEWLADNLSETRFRNGDIIPWYGADSANFFTNAEWVALTTAGCCAYSNGVNNVAVGFTFPT